MGALIGRWAEVRQEAAPSPRRQCWFPLGGTGQGAGGRLAPGFRFRHTRRAMSSAALLQHLTFALGLALLSAAAVRAMIAWPILDHPNGRSAHVRPTPRGGGVGAVLAFIVGMLVLYQVANSARIAE